MEAGGRNKMDNLNEFTTQKKYLCETMKRSKHHGTKRKTTDRT